METRSVRTHRLSFSLEEADEGGVTSYELYFINDLDTIVHGSKLWTSSHSSIYSLICRYLDHCSMDCRMHATNRPAKRRGTRTFEDPCDVSRSESMTITDTRKVTARHLPLSPSISLAHPRACRNAVRLQRHRMC